ncbi:MAG: DNA polymerase III subunit chi [Gammaproteobacteria bacterium]
MAAVSFYLLPTQSEQERLLFACKLAEKAYREGRNVFILADSETQCKTMDDLLWTFRAGSFIPHQIFRDRAPPPENKVVIGMQPPPHGWENTIINLTSACPENPENFQRILEILDEDKDSRQSGRERYRRYQKSSHQLNTYKM